MAAPLVGLALVGGLLLSLRPPLGMVRLPGGPFTLGEPYRDARSVPPYWLDREEVTQEDFLGWLTQRGVKREPAGARDEDGALLWEPQAASLTTATRPRLPAVGVTYEGAQRFCQARGRRLVRYEEWDLAARGAERMLSFPWGEEPPRCAGVVFARQSAREGAFAACQGDGAGPREVGSAPQDHSAEGVRDLAGNVSEWVEVPGANRYSRGGSFARPAESCHSGYYSQLEPGAGYMDVGFRCARDAGRWRF